MTSAEFAHWKREILPQLRMPDDEPPRVMEHGEGKQSEFVPTLRGALAEHQGSEMVRGFKLYHVPLTAKRWRGREAWKAVFWCVVKLAKTPNSNKNIYRCFTRPDESEMGLKYIFLPSARAHAELTDELILSGHWITGVVVGGNEMFTRMAIVDQLARGHRRSVVGITPERVVARRASKVFLMPCFAEWVKARGLHDTESLAEMMGFPVVDCESTLDITSNRGIRMAILDNHDALVNGLRTLELQSTSLTALYSGTATTDSVRAQFFDHYDEQKTHVDKKLSAKLDAELRKLGFESPPDKTW